MDAAREKSNLLAVSIVVMNEEGHILLRKRQKEPDQGTWELFAGYPFLDEMPLDKAISRILREKAGISVYTSCTFTGKYYDASGRHPGKPCIPLIFKVLIADTLENAENVRWFAPAELTDLPMALDNKTTLTDLGIF